MENLKKIQTIGKISKIVALVVCVLLAVLNSFTNPQYYWSGWVALIWGALLVVRGLRLFGFCADRRDSVREHSRKLAFRIGTGERHGGNRQLAVRLERSA